jgi:hypothetical protein
MRRVGVVVVVVVAVCSTVMSCGDDGDESDDAPPTVAASQSAGSSASPTAATSEPSPSVDAAADQESAEEALLVLADFPAGWSELPERDRSAEDEAVLRTVAACAGAEGTSAIDVGGALARTGNFTSPSGAAIAETVSVAPSEEEAAARATAVADAGFASCAGEAYQDWAEQAVTDEDTEIGAITVAPLNVSNVGAATVAYRVTIPFESDGTSAGEVYADLVVVQAGRALAGLLFQSELAPFPIDETKHYVALATERLGQAS